MKKLLVLGYLLLAVATGTSHASSAAPAEFSGITQWFNSPPLTMAGLRGKVVLVDFWAYSCINCIRAMPHVEHLYETYKDKGLVVVGVHSPEFDFEQDPANVRAAMERMHITYPVAMDNHLDTWRAWHNAFWPAEYLVDANGRLIGHHYGEGDYDRMENAIRLLLGMDMSTPGPRSDGAAPGPGDTSELHLGSDSQHGFGNLESGREGVRRFTIPPRLALHHFALSGPWEITRECARSMGQTELHIRFKAARLYVVASARAPTPLDVQVDGKPQPAVTVQGSRLYTLFDSHDDAEHVLVLRIRTSDVRVYSVTFG